MTTQTVTAARFAISPAVVAKREFSTAHYNAVDALIQIKDAAEKLAATFPAGTPEAADAEALAQFHRDLILTYWSKAELSNKVGEAAFRV